MPTFSPCLRSTSRLREVFRRYCSRLTSPDNFFVLANVLESGAACTFQRWRRRFNRARPWVLYLSYEVAGGGHALATVPLGTPIPLSAALAGCPVYDTYGRLFSHVHRRASLHRFTREGGLMSVASPAGPSVQRIREVRHRPSWRFKCASGGNPVPL